MEINSIYPPPYVTSILNPSPMKNLQETDKTGGALKELNSIIDLVQTPAQNLELDQELGSRSVMSYDMYGELNNNSLTTPGTRIDTYA